MAKLTVSENALGATVVRLHYSADPAKDPLTEEGATWYDTMRRLYPDENKWAQEFEINWWTAKGTRVYPEFSESLHTKPLEVNRRKVIYRAWDFGWHAPACLIAQIDPKDRLVLLREMVGHEQTTKQFAETVIARCAKEYPTHTAGFQDFCDPAGQQRRSTAETSEVRDVEILNNLGVYPSWKHGWTRNHGRSLVHQLLVLRADGTPGLYADPAHCPVLLQGFLGRYVYEPRKGGQVADEPDEANHPWADIHACLRYLVTGLYNALGLRLEQRPPKPNDPPSWHGYGSPIRR